MALVCPNRAGSIIPVDLPPSRNVNYNNDEVTAVDHRMLHTLEYDKVVERMVPFAASRIGKEKVRQLTPLKRLSDAEKALAATAEGVDVLRLKDDVPLGGIRDIRQALKRARIGSMLSSSELLDVASTVYSGRRLKRFLLDVVEGEDLSLPIIERQTERLTPLMSLEKAIRRVIDEHGEIVDHASEELQKIRQAIRRTEGEIRKKLEQMVKSRRYRNMLQEPIVTMRQDRYVIPIKQEYRAQVGGIVHDQSASGATLFIEPQSTVALNHRLREWQWQEEREEERLLRELTEKVAKTHDPLWINIEVLAELDLIFAKASYARYMNASLPKLNDRGYLHLHQARHPLIAPEDVVPIDVRLGETYRALVVTGPNTGGKTVTLKTIGLLTLMAMSGLFIPAQDGSEIAVFEHVFADIGDEQSIEQNLSTFSGHMANIIRILADLSENSLILLDELGAGTDPTEGAALAIALLDHIIQRGCRVVATTHYNELKAYAYNRDDVMNASVEFDVETLSPTYRLLIGVPGRSNAFLIAERLGLSPHIIETAKAHLSTDDNRVEDMIASLEANRKSVEKEREEAASLRQEAEKLRAKMEREITQLERERDRLRQRAEEEARSIVLQVKKEADAIIRELRFRYAQATAVKEHEFIDFKKRLDELEPEQKRWNESPAPPKRWKPATPLKPGDEVFIHALQQKGDVIAILDDEEIQVQIGAMKMNVHRRDVELIKRQTSMPRESTMTSIHRAKENVSLELDLRGSTIDEAIQETDKYLDDAILAGLPRVSLIHGKGTGALRRGIHQFLRTHQHVKQFRLGKQGEGGSGATIVELQ